MKISRSIFTRFLQLAINLSSSVYGKPVCCWSASNHVQHIGYINKVYTKIKRESNDHEL